MSIGEWTNDIHEGDTTETLQQLPESSVHMAMCSPPYYGLRDYGIDGQIGLEESLDEYIQNLVAVGDELRRVLRPDGSWWLNLGDSYAGGGGNKGVPDDWESKSTDRGGGIYPDEPPARDVSLGRKQKMLVPHRTAIALQEAGWIVRNDAVWAKPNPMPESVTDRLSTTFEFVFHLTPEPDYWYDLDAIREPYSEYSHRMKHRQESGVERGDHTPHGGIGDPENTRADMMHAAGKNPGDVFEVATKPYPDAHFAVYPPELCEKPIKATCPPEVCAECGGPYERQVERPSIPDEYIEEKAGHRDVKSPDERNDNARRHLRGQEMAEFYEQNPPDFKGWVATCDCGGDDTQPGIALDPFAGAGTTCLVAKRLGRRFIGIDLNPEYVAMAQQRVGIDIDQPDLLLEEGEQTIHQFIE